MARLTTEQRGKLRAWLQANDTEMWLMGWTYRRAATEATVTLKVVISPWQMARYRPLNRDGRWRGGARPLIDCEVAYDSCEWRHLEEVLRRHRAGLPTRSARHAARYLAVQGHHYSVPAIGEMMRLLGIAGWERDRR